MSRSVGLQLSESMVRAAVVEQKGRRVAITGFFEAAIPEADTPWEERATGAIKEILTKGKLPRLNTVAGLDSGDMVIRNITVPFKEEAQIRRTVKFELETQITNYAAEDLVVDFSIISETENGAVLLAVAAPKDVLKSRLKAMADAGMDPAVVDLELMAVVRSLHAAGELTQDEPLLIVHGSAKYAKLVLLESGQVRNMRTIRFSLPGEEKAEPAKKLAAVPLIVVAGDPDRMSTTVRQTLIGLLSKEISRFLLGAAGAGPTQVVLTGEFESPAIAKQLQKAIKVPVNTVDVLKAFDHPFSGAQAVEMRRKILEPLGLALRGLPGAEEGLDFRQEEFVFARKLERVAGAGMIFLELLLVLIAAFCLNHFFRYRDARKAHDTLTVAKQEFYEDTANEPLPAGLTPYDAMKRWAMTKGAGAADYPVRRSALDELARLTAVIDRFGQANVKRPGSPQFYLEMTNINANLNPADLVGTIILTCVISSQDDADKLRQEFQREGLQFEPPSVQPDPRSGRWNFTIKIVISRKQP